MQFEIVPSLVLHFRKEAIVPTVFILRDYINVLAAFLQSDNPEVVSILLEDSCCKMETICLDMALQKKQLYCNGSSSSARWECVSWNSKCVQPAPQIVESIFCSLSENLL